MRDSIPSLIVFGLLSLSLVNPVASPRAHANSTAETASAQSDCAGSPRELHECLGERLALANIEMNTLVKALQSKLAAQIGAANQATEDLEKREALEADRRLRASQKAWAAYRDAECDLQGIEMLGGPGEALLITSCRLEKTEVRIVDLKALGL